MTKEEEIAVRQSIKAIAEMLFQTVDVQWLIIQSLAECGSIKNLKQAQEMVNRIKEGKGKIESIGKKGGEDER